MKVLRTAATKQSLSQFASLGTFSHWHYVEHDAPDIVLHEPNFWSGCWQRLRPLDRITVVVTPGKRPNDYEGEPGVFELIVTRVDPPFTTGPEKTMHPAVVRAEPYANCWPSHILKRRPAPAVDAA